MEDYRAKLIKTCEGIDRHGVFSDKDCMLEMGYIPTIEELEACLVNLWQDESGLTDKEVITEAMSFYVKGA